MSVQMSQPEPTVRIDALETFVELLARVEADRLDATTSTAACARRPAGSPSMDRAVIFRYDDARRRVRAAGAYGIDLERLRRTPT